LSAYGALTGASKWRYFRVLNQVGFKGTPFFAEFGGLA
jgi:hypothetical protein